MNAKSTILSYGQGERKPNITTRVFLGLCYDLVVEMSYITPNVYSKSPVQFTHYELAGIIPGFVTTRLKPRSFGNCPIFGEMIDSSLQTE